MGSDKEQDRRPQQDTRPADFDEVRNNEYMTESFKPKEGNGRSSDQSRRTK